jgi:hypothetical protein
MDLLSSTAFMGTDNSGLPSEATWTDDGRYQVVGSLTVAPSSVTKINVGYLSAISRLFEELRSNPALPCD